MIRMYFIYFYFFQNKIPMLGQQSVWQEQAEFFLDLKNKHPGHSKVPIFLHNSPLNGPWYRAHIYAIQAGTYTTTMVLVRHAQEARSEWGSALQLKVGTYMTVLPCCPDRTSKPKPGFQAAHMCVYTTTTKLWS